MFAINAICRDKLKKSNLLKEIAKDHNILF
jgi:hypothetical protein